MAGPTGAIVMTDEQYDFRTDQDLNLVITDSGLGGLSICAGIERNVRHAGRSGNTRLTYFNAWPEPRSGYNDMPDPQTRARIFNRAVVRMADLRPDRILIACNTLSILYPLTDYQRTASIPVIGIIDVGVGLFCEALIADPSGSILLLGTRITIESGIHRERLLQSGIQDHRIAALACHGLAAAIDKDPDSKAVLELIDRYASEACQAGLIGNRTYIGLCCTHFGYVKDEIHSAFVRRTGKEIRILNPNQRMADCTVPPGERGSLEADKGRIAVEVISKVELSDHQRRAMAGRLESVSGSTARALLSYTWIPDLF